MLLASIAFRLPFLINAEGTNSDAAVVGLQAMHLLRGEVSPFLWGSGYQTSADSWVAALWFLVTGPSPLALTASTLVGHIVLTWLCFDALRRTLTDQHEGTRPEWTAALLVTPLVFTPQPVHTYVLYPPRQAALTLTFFAFWLAHTAARAERSRLRFGVAGAVASLAVLADPYALLFLPAHALHALLAAHDNGDQRARRERLGVWALGALLGIAPYLALRHHPEASAGQTSLHPEVLRHNLQLLVDVCGPWLLSTTVYAARRMSDFVPWDAGPFHAVQILGAIVLVVGVVAVLPLALGQQRKALPWEIRRLGLVGALLVATAIAGFLISPMVMDHFSARYLAAIVLILPFALAPVVVRLGRARAAGALLPYLCSAAISGWVSYRPFGLSQHPSIALDERLGAALRERDITYAVADYWASYRLTFAWREHPIVVPTNQLEDRYAPYRVAFDREPRIAYLYDALRSRESLPEVEAKIQRGETPFEPNYDRLEMETFTVLLLRRRVAIDGVASAEDR